MNEVAIFDSYAHTHSLPRSLIHTLNLSSQLYFSLFPEPNLENGNVTWWKWLLKQNKRVKERKMPRNKGFPWLYYRETKLLVPGLPLHSPPSPYSHRTFLSSASSHWLSHRVFIHRKIYILLRLLLSCFSHVHRLVWLIVLNFCFIQSEKLVPSY